MAAKRKAPTNTKPPAVEEPKTPENSPAVEQPKTVGKSAQGEKVRYFSVIRNLHLDFPAFTKEGKCRRGPQAQFCNGMFETSDPNLQNLIESHPKYGKKVFRGHPTAGQVKSVSVEYVPGVQTTKTLANQIKEEVVR